MAHSVDYAAKPSDQLVVAGMNPNSLVARNSVFDRIHIEEPHLLYLLMASL